MNLFPSFHTLELFLSNPEANTDNLIGFRSQLPARATRLLNRRLQNNSNSPLSQNGSDSPRSLDSMHSRNTPTKTSLRDHLKQRQQLNLQSHVLNSSSEDLVVDKSLRNSMLQDVVCFKKQLVHLRRILQEVSSYSCVVSFIHILVVYRTVFGIHKCIKNCIMINNFSFHVLFQIFLVFASFCVMICFEIHMHVNMLRNRFLFR